MWTAAADLLWGYGRCFALGTYLASFTSDAPRPHDARCVSQTNRREPKIFITFWIHIPCSQIGVRVPHRAASSPCCRHRSKCAVPASAVFIYALFNRGLRFKNLQFLLQACFGGVGVFPGSIAAKPQCSKWRLVRKVACFLPRTTVLGGRCASGGVAATVLIGLIGVSGC